LAERGEDCDLSLVEESYFKGRDCVYEEVLRNVKELEYAGVEKCPNFRISSMFPH